MWSEKRVGIGRRRMWVTWLVAEMDVSKSLQGREKKRKEGGGERCAEPSNKDETQRLEYLGMPVSLKGL